MPAITGRGSGCGPASGNRPSTNPRGRARRYGDLKILVLRCRGRGACNLTLTGASEQRQRSLIAQLWQGPGGRPVDLAVISAVVELAVDLEV